MEAVAAIAAVVVGFVTITRKQIAAIAANAIVVALHVALLVYMTNYWLANQMQPTDTQPTVDPMSIAVRDSIRNSIHVTAAIGWYLACACFLIGLLFSCLPKKVRIAG